MTRPRTPPLRGCICCTDAVSSIAAPSRRSFMCGVGALALATAVGGGRASAQAQAEKPLSEKPLPEKPFRIDVHHHLSPPTYVTASNEIGFGDPLMKNWTIEKSLSDMDKAGIATSMLSVSATNTPRGWSPIIPDASAILRCYR